MKITFEESIESGHRVTIEKPGASKAVEALELFVEALHGAGLHHEKINQAIHELSATTEERS